MYESDTGHKFTDVGFDYSDYSVFPIYPKIKTTRLFLKLPCR